MGICSMCLVGGQIQSQKHVKYIEKEIQSKNHSQSTKISQEEQKETIHKRVIIKELDQILQYQPNDGLDKSLNIEKQPISNRTRLGKTKYRFCSQQNKFQQIKKGIMEYMLSQELSRNIKKINQIRHNQQLAPCSTSKKQIENKSSSDNLEDGISDEKVYYIQHCCIKTIQKEIQNQRALSKKDQQLIHKSLSFTIPTKIDKEVLFKNNSIYKGEWMNGMRDGIGCLIFRDHIRYEGEWKLDKISGKGLYISQNGQIYDGQWQNNEACGSGKYKFKDGSVYVGQWKNSMQQGMGMYIWLNGDRYAGLWSKGKKNGYGELSFQDGSFYRGQFLNNQLHGQGQYYWYQEKSYQGQWIHNQMTGNGTLSWKNGEWYEGEFKNGKFEGKGKLFYKNGFCSEGQWENGRKHGKVVEQDINGDIKTVEYYFGKIIKECHKKDQLLLSVKQLIWTDSIVDEELSHRDY